MITMSKMLFTFYNYNYVGAKKTECFELITIFVILKYSLLAFVFLVKLFIKINFSEEWEQVSLF